MKKFVPILIINLLITCIFIKKINIKIYEIGNFFIILAICLLSILISFFNEIKENITYFSYARKKNFFNSIFLLISSLIYSKILFIFNVDVYKIFFSDIGLYSPIIIFIIFITSFFFKKSNKIYSRKELFLMGGLKVIYIPFMYGACSLALSSVLNKDFNFSNFNIKNFVDILFDFGILFDVFVGFCGYVFISHIFNNEIISVNKNIKAWFFCLLCYPPLNILLHNYFYQHDSYIWSDFSKNNFYIYLFLALILTLSWIVYWLSTFSFGLRFSNLTWRGIVNSGMYKYFKHPAYVSKNIYWWVYTVPFYTSNFKFFLLNIIALSLISFIYFMRAKTEEEHLMEYDEYKKYVLNLRSKRYYYVNK